MHPRTRQHLDRVFCCPRWLAVGLMYLVVAPMGIWFQTRWAGVSAEVAAQSTEFWLVSLTMQGLFVWIVASVVWRSRR